MCQMSVSSTRNATLALEKPRGPIWGVKEPLCGNGGTQIPTFPEIGPFYACSHCFIGPNNILAAEKNLGRYLGGEKSPQGNGDTHYLALGCVLGLVFCHMTEVSARNIVETTRTDAAHLFRWG